MNLEDRAQEHEAALWTARQQPRVSPPQYKSGDALYGPPECVACDAEMPDFRRQHGWYRCTACQTKAERKR